jgi:hypothetical protein
MLQPLFIDTVAESGDAQDPVGATGQGP